MMKYSTITTCFNDEKSIIPYLDNVCRQSAPPAEIVIADGGSKDKTATLVEEYKAQHPEIDIRFLGGGRLNIAQGFNTAIKAARNDMIIVTGLGNEYETDCFEKLIEAYGSEEADFFYPLIRGKDTTTFSVRYNNTFLDHNNGVNSPVALNHCVLARKDIFYKLDFYYENFIYAGEDTEFFSRAYDKGYKSQCVTDAYLYWETPKTLKGSSIN